MQNFPILSFITFLPIVGMILVLFMPKQQPKLIKILTLFITAIQLITAAFYLAVITILLEG